jgi:hypothetical protein
MNRCKPMKVNLPPGAAWIDALDYRRSAVCHPAPDRFSLVYDGHLRGEIREHGCVNGSAVGLGFGRMPATGLTSSYTWQKTLPAAALMLRYRLEASGAATFTLSGAARSA